MKIIQARIEKGSMVFGFSDDPNAGRGRVIVTLENGTEEEAFSYYLDELAFSPTEFLGKTLEEARQIHHRKDVAYLRS